MRVRSLIRAFLSPSKESIPAGNLSGRARLFVDGSTGPHCHVVGPEKYLDRDDARMG
jgi:hypothetical protein